VTESGPDEPSGRPGAAGRSTAIFAIWTAVSRVAGLVREIIAAAIYGVGPAIDAFVVAFQVPNLLRSLVADSALSAAFVPKFTELDELGRRREAARLAGAFIGLISLVLGLISIVAIITAPWVMPLFAPSLPDDATDLLVRLSQIMFPIVVMLGLTGLVMGILQASGEFAATAFVPVLWNVVIIAALLGITPFLEGDDRIYAYAIGILVGTAVQLLYLLPGLRGKGPFPLSLGRGNPHVRGVLLSMIPVTVALGLINFTLVVNSFFADRIEGEGHIRALDAAFRLYILPQGIFSVAVSTVLFPMISRMAARQDIAGMGRVVTDGIRQIFFLLIPATAFLALLAEPVTRLVFEHLNFDAAATELTSGALLFFTVGLVFNGGSLLLIRAFFALKQTRVPMRVAVGTLLVNAILDLALVGPLGVEGIALATSVASFVGFMALAILLQRQIGGLDLDSIRDGFLRTCVAGLWLGAVSWATWEVLDDALGRSLPAQIVTVGAALVTGTLAYISAARGLELPELRAMARVVRSLR
jgi:putative peptidoglycan lipid II flippase